MELDLKGRKAIVSAASKGLGKACAFSLAREGVDLAIMARTEPDLVATAEEIAAATGVSVTPVAGDFNDADERARLLEACPEPDILVNNPGVRQVPTAYQSIDKEEWLRWLNDHFLSSITLIQAVAPGMCERGLSSTCPSASSSSRSRDSRTRMLPGLHCQEPLRRWHAT
jgi:3-oxoacyl-[acyl-carrier protein] reductase